MAPGHKSSTIRRRVSDWLTLLRFTSRMKRSIAFALIATSLTAACVGPPDGGRPRGKPPVAQLPDNKAIRQCMADLNRMSARYTLLPDRDQGGGCSAINSIALTGVGVPVTNVKAIQCPLARTFALWVRGSVATAAKEHFDSRIARVETMGAYACRNVVGNPRLAGNRSEHATANAIDVSAFVLSDGRRISVEAGWNSTDSEERAFLRTIRTAACKSFGTVLSPDYNAAHYNHFHLDLSSKNAKSGGYCR